MDTTTLICAECGKTGHDVTEVDGAGILCHACFDASYGFCTNCALLCEHDDITEVNDKEILCPDCFADRYCRCSSCRDICDLEDAIEVNRQYLCQDCFNENYCYCAACDDIVRLDHAYTSPDSPADEYCENCFYRFYNYCERCGEAVSLEEMTDDNYCHECSVSMIQHSRTIAPYSTDVLDILPFGTLRDGANFHIGVEYEVTFPQDINTRQAAEDVYRAAPDDVICKRDGSLSNGFEIVTRPLDYRDAKDVLTTVVNALADYSPTPYNDRQAGLHTHISRSAFQNSGALSLLVWMFNHDAFRLTVTAIAKRYDANYAMKTWVEGEENLSELKSSILHDTRCAFMPNGRHMMVNVLPLNTIEIRAYRSTANIERLRACVDFSVMMTEAANALVREITDETETKDVFNELLPAFVNRNIERYPDLLRFIASSERNRPAGSLFSYIALRKTNNQNQQEENIEICA